MTIDNTEPGGAPAGLEPVSGDSATDRIAALLGDDLDTSEAPQRQQPEPTDEGDDEERAAAPVPETDQDADQPDEAGEPEEVDEPETTSQKVRLRDGTEVDIGDLKKAYAAQRDFEQKQREYEANAQKIAQQEQFFQQVLPQAIQMLEANIPPEPDPELLRTDPISHYEQTIARQQAIGKLQQLQQAQSAQQQQHQQKQQEGLHQYIQREQQALFEKVPELRESPQKRQEFYEKTILTTAREYGFRDEEVHNTYDHRLVLMMRDAAAYRALQKQKPAVEKKTQNAAPVVRPGKRVSASEQKSQERADRMKRLRETGSADDAAALIADLID